MLPYGSKFTPRTTPYHIMELILQLMRITFKTVDQPDFPFQYTDDFLTTKLLIDTTYNKQSGQQGVKPQIVVSHGDAGSQVISTGDMAEKNLTTCAATRTSIVTSSCMARVIGKSKTDVDILSNEIFNFFLACRSLLPGKLTSISNIQNVNMTQVVPFAMDDTLFQSIVSIVYQMQYKWTHRVTQNVLEGYKLLINEDTVIDK